MKEETTRDLVRTMAEDDLPVPAWTRVKMRASFEDQLATRQAPFAPLIWVEMAIYAGVGISLAALVLWVIMNL